MGLPSTDQPRPSVRPQRSTAIMMVDDHPIRRSGVRKILDDQDDRVVGEAGNAEDARRLLEERLPSLVILDIGLPGVRGIQLATDILAIRPDTRVIFLTVYQARSPGASGTC